MKFLIAFVGLIVAVQAIPAAYHMAPAAITYQTQKQSLVPIGTTVQTHVSQPTSMHSASLAAAPMVLDYGAPMAAAPLDLSYGKPLAAAPLAFGYDKTIAADPIALGHAAPMAAASLGYGYGKIIGAAPLAYGKTLAAPALAYGH